MLRHIAVGAALLFTLAAGAALGAEPSSQPSRSIAAVLDMDHHQIDQLDRYYDDYARTRLEQESKMADLHDQLKRAQEQVPTDSDKVKRLTHEINDREQRIVDAFVKASSSAMKQLTDEQRAKLLKVRVDKQDVLDDKYQQLLLLKVEDIWKNPVPDPVVRELLTAQAYEHRSPRYYEYGCAPYPYWGFGWGGGYPLFVGPRYYYRPRPYYYGGWHGGGYGHFGGGYGHWGGGWHGGWRGRR